MCDEAVIAASEAASAAESEAKSEADASAPEDAPISVSEAAAALTHVETVNRRNAQSSTGKVTDDGRGAVFFTSADVRAMSRLEIRANLDRILKSMESPDF